MRKNLARRYGPDGFRSYLNPKMVLFFSESCNGNYYANALLFLVRPNCCMDFNLSGMDFYLKSFDGLLPQSQGQNMAITVLHVPYRGTSLIRNRHPPLGPP